MKQSYLLKVVSSHPQTYLIGGRAIGNALHFDASIARERLEPGEVVHLGGKAYTLLSPIPKGAALKTSERGAFTTLDESIRLEYSHNLESHADQ